MQSIPQIMRHQIKSLRYGKEYSYSVFSEEIQAIVIRKNIERLNGDLIGKTTNGHFYKKLNKKNAERPYDVPDSEVYALFDPKEYSFNAFWSSGSSLSRQSVKSIIRNYLSAMNPVDVKILIGKFGIGRVKSELITMFKEDYKRGYVDIKGMQVRLSGRWDRNPAYRYISKILT